MEDERRTSIDAARGGSKRRRVGGGGAIRRGQDVVLYVRLLAIDKVQEVAVLAVEEVLLHVLHPAQSR